MKVIEGMIELVCGFHQIGELKLQKNIEEMKRGVSEVAFSFTEGGRRFGDS